MIYAALALNRDSHIKFNTFGYRDQFHIQDSYGHLITPKFGIRIERDASLYPMTPRLVKFVEGYIVNKQEVFIERLCYMHKNYLYPYRIRYITSDIYKCRTMVVPRNMEHVHVILQRDIDPLYTPAVFYLTQLRPDYMFGDEKSNEIDPRTELLECLCEDSNLWNDQFDTLRHYLSEPGLRDYHLAQGKSAQVDFNIQLELKPKIPFCDPVTYRFLTKPISTRELPYYSTGTKITDVGLPNELPIRYPELTHFSPREQMLTVAAINEIEYSDLEIEYILSNSAVVSSKVKLLYDRYDRHLDQEYQLRLCQVAAVSCIRNMNSLIDPEQYLMLFSDIRVVFHKTFNDEAMFEIYTLDNNRPIAVCHIDMALLSLCSVGVLSSELTQPSKEVPLCSISYK